jgi:hypothetical protein
VADAFHLAATSCDAWWIARTTQEELLVQPAGARDGWQAARDATHHHLDLDHNLERYIAAAAISDDRQEPLFRPTRSHKL